MSKLAEEPDVISARDTLSSAINDCIRIILVMLIGHLAKCMYEHDAVLFSKEFVNGTIFYIFGTVVFYVFFHSRCTLPSKIVFSSPRIL